MRGLLRGLTAALALAYTASAQPAAVSARDALREGDRLWRLKRTHSALEALSRAAAQKDTAAEAHVRIGRIYLFKGAEAEGAFPGWHEEVEYRAKALAEFEEALRLRPGLNAALHGRWRALRALGRDAGPEPSLPADPDAAPAAQIQELRAAKKHAELIEAARAFAARFPESERLPAVYDAWIEALQANPETPATALAAAIDARIAARPDPGAYLAGANLLLARNVLPERARRLAEDAVTATETFIEENAGSYKLADKATGSLNRARAASADLVGWALFKEGDVAGAEARLLEAERLSRALDFGNQVHLAELYRKKGVPDEARERYVNALSLTSGGAAPRAAAQQALTELGPGRGQPDAGFDAWLKRELDRRRDERRSQLLGSMVDQPLPRLPLVTLSGEPLDQSKLRGRVLLYKFFASW
jgi:hypothetical protein